MVRASDWYKGLGSESQLVPLWIELLSLSQLLTVPYFKKPILHCPLLLKFPQLPPYQLTCAGLGWEEQGTVNGGNKCAIFQGYERQLSQLV